MIGKIISGFCQGAIKGVAVGLVIYLLTPFRFPSPNLIIYLFFIILGSMIFSCLGTICGTVIDKPENIGRVQAVVIVPLIFMAGIFFPLSSYPVALLPLIRALPTTAVFEGARQALLKGVMEIGFAVNLLATAAVMFGLAVWIFNRKIEE